MEDFRAIDLKFQAFRVHVKWTQEGVTVRADAPEKQVPFRTALDQSWVVLPSGVFVNDTATGRTDWFLKDENLMLERGLRGLSLLLAPPKELPLPSPPLEPTQFGFGPCFDLGSGLSRVTWGSGSPTNGSLNDWKVEAQIAPAGAPERLELKRGDWTVRWDYADFRPVAGLGAWPHRAVGRTQGSMPGTITVELGDLSLLTMGASLPAVPWDKVESYTDGLGTPPLLVTKEQAVRANGGKVPTSTAELRAIFAKTRPAIERAMKRDAAAFEARQAAARRDDVGSVATVALPVALVLGWLGYRAWKRRGVR